MNTRIIDSCALSVPMVTSKGAETRILRDNSSKWQGVANYCINNKKYLIVTPCVNDGMNKTSIPSETDWETIIFSMCLYLRMIGMDMYNGKISIINEPTKFFRDNGGVVKYTKYINLAYPIVKSFDFVIGAGNMEFHDAAVLGDWYGYICKNANFDDLDIHIQGSCDNEDRIKKYTDYAKSLATTYNKELDCTEAFYGNITTSSGYDLLQRQYFHAERIGCKNFGNVFNNLDTSVFPILSVPKVRKKWYELCFNINSEPHSPYWAEWYELIKRKGEKLTDYLRPDELQEVYDALGLNTPYRWKTPNLYVVGEKDPNSTVKWADIDAMTETQMKALIYGLKKLGILHHNFPDYPNIKYRADGSWNPGWKDYAKSKPS